MAENNFNGVVDSLMKGMDGFLSTKTVVGDATTIGDTIIVPLVDVSFGVGAGTLNGEKNKGGAGSLNGKMTPSAILVISNGHTKLVNIKNQDSVTKILDLIPDLVDRFHEKGKEAALKEEDVKKAAFPEGIEEN
ncbi:MAG: GerW family sporulation protein [Lachnospiraceae bacterium]|nr:GerW family sporulation protein [Lachnospiraceae bacterium]